MTEILNITVDKSNCLECDNVTVCMVPPTFQMKAHPSPSRVK